VSARVIPSRALSRAALRRARIELRQQLFSPLVLGSLIGPVLGLAAVVWLRDNPLMESVVSLGAFLVPALITFTIVNGAVLGVAGEMITERDDGTLLRAKAVPRGMAGHLLGKLAMYTGTTLFPIIILVIGASFVLDGVTPDSLGDWARLAAVGVLAMSATLPFGAVLGSLFRSPLSVLWVMLIVYGISAVSGIFYPLGELPVWLQWVAQVFPVYWIGLGVRSAMLPDEAVTLEIAESWRTLETFAVLGLWTALGLVLAPMALRRMARRQSGSAVAAARERVMSRGY
jgi:ABC-2 type transport system permease protein